MIKLPVILDFIKRHATWIIIGVVALFLLGFAIEALRTVLLVCVYEALAIALSGIALWVYTNIPFTKELSQGKDGIMDRAEMAYFQRVIAAVFIGVHLLVAIVVLGSQFLEVDKAYSEKEKAAVTDTCKATKMSTIPLLPMTTMPMSTIPEKVK